MNDKMKQMLEIMEEDQQKALDTVPGFSVGTLDVRVYGTKNKDCPVLYINSVPGIDYEIWQRKKGLPPFVMVSITNLNWGTDMAPWYCPPCGPGDTPCFGGASDYLKILTNQIMPKAEAMLGFDVKTRWLAGYSLAGLFAYWSLYETDLFSRIICGSGSFWYPDLEEFVKTHEMKQKPESIFFSLGKKESHTQYPIYNTVQVRAEWLEQYVKSLGIETTFVLEPGNHYTDPAGRMLKGIAWTFTQ